MLLLEYIDPPRILFTIMILLVVFIGLVPKGLERNFLPNQQAWTGVFLFWLTGMVIPNLFLGMLVILMGMSLIQIMPPSKLMDDMGWRTLAYLGAYALAVPHVEPWMLLAFCEGMVGLGVCLGGWVLYGLTKRGKVSWKPFESHPRLQGLHYHENRSTIPNANQGQGNHLHCVATLCTASAVAGWWGTECVFFLLAIPLTIMPIIGPLLFWMLKVREYSRKPLWGQGWGHLFIILTVVSVLQWGWMAALIALPYFLGGVWWAILHDEGLQERMIVWRKVLVESWIPAGWVVWTIGHGLGSWKYLTGTFVPSRTNPKNITKFSAAHSEPLIFLVQYGLVGLLLFSLGVGDALMRGWTGGVHGEMLLIMGVPFLTIAAINFPFTHLHSEILKEQEHFVGNVVLMNFTLCLGILIDGILGW